MDLWDFLLCSMVAAVISAIVGEITISLAYRVNRHHVRELNREVQRYQLLSEEAAVLADGEVYRAINREGNEAFGRLFFHKIALSAASLWPIFFALQWLQDRYSSRAILIPGTSWEANYVVSFLICYIVVRILFGRLKDKLPYFRRVNKMLEEDQQQREEFKLTDGK
ncbi:MAG: hypothetical protein ACUVS3_07640 [Thermodesulfobacteriota bacterium]